MEAKLAPLARRSKPNPGLKSETWATRHLNRLTTAASTTSPYYPNLSIAWTYDAFGNRQTQIASPSGEAPDHEALAYTGYSRVNGSQPPNAPVYNNRIDGSSYDASGNLLDDGAQSYLYDGEGRLCAQKSDWGPEMEGYIYDGMGHRISEGSIASFSCDASANGYQAAYNWVNGLDGKELEETQGNGSMMHMDVDMGGQLLASFAYANWYYTFNDWVGTKRATVLQDGTPQLTYPSLPYGDGATQEGSGTDVSEIHFAGQPLDMITLNHSFGARDYRDSLSRFMTPDWSDGPDTIPYAKYADPQTLNLYSYAGNNPLSNIDPDGHDCIYATGVGSGYKVKSGDCYGDTDSGIYVNGTVTSANYNASNNSIGYTYAAYDTGNLGTGVIANVPVPQPMDEGAATDESGGLLTGIAGGMATDYVVGRIAGLFGRGAEVATKGAEDALTPPAYTNTPGGFVNWLKNLSHADTKLTSSQADAIVQQAKQLGVDVRLDPPHPGTNWDMPHLNIGREGQVHLEVPQGYSNPTIP